MPEYSMQHKNGEWIFFLFPKIPQHHLTNCLLVTCLWLLSSGFLKALLVLANLDTQKFKHKLGNIWFSVIHSEKSILLNSAYSSSISLQAAISLQQAHSSCLSIIYQWTHLYLSICLYAKGWIMSSYAIICSFSENVSLSTERILENF